MITGKYVAITDTHFTAYLVDGLPRLSFAPFNPRETWFFTYEGHTQKDIFSMRDKTMGNARHRQLECDRLLLDANSVIFTLENAPPQPECLRTADYQRVKGLSGLTWMGGTTPLASFRHDGTLLGIWDEEKARFAASFRGLFQLPRAAA